MSSVITHDGERFLLGSEYARIASELAAAYADMRMTLSRFDEERGVHRGRSVVMSGGPPSSNWFPAKTLWYDVIQKRLYENTVLNKNSVYQQEVKSAWSQVHPEVDGHRFISIYEDGFIIGRRCEKHCALVQYDY